MRAPGSPVALVLWGLILSVPAFGESLPAQQGSLPPKSEEGRGKLGSIELDRAKKRFTVPGVVIRREPPLEYVAVAKGGMKAYESLLELDTNGLTFNLACLLLGLDGAKARLPEHQFDPKPAEGERVRIWVVWTEEGKSRRSSLGDMFAVQGAGKPPEEWVYTGSTFTPDGRYLPESTGNLIGMVHDPSSVIEHRTGVGIGGYGSVGADFARCPPAGTAITLTVEREGP